MKKKKIMTSNITFTSKSVIDALNKLSKEEQKKFATDIIKSQIDGSDVQLNIDGKNVNFRKNKLIQKEKSIFALKIST